MVCEASGFRVLERVWGVGPQSFGFRPCLVVPWELFLI